MTERGTYSKEKAIEDLKRRTMAGVKLQREFNAKRKNVVTPRRRGW